MSEPLVEYDAATTAAVVDLGRLSLAFGRVDRITYHDDGTTLESDTDHTVMLGLVACAFAAKHVPDLDVGLVAQFALVHDLPEVYAGDTPTLRVLSADDKQAKADREAAAVDRIYDEYANRLPWVSRTLARYEQRRSPEARYVKAIDKLLPKVTHLLNGCVTVRAEGMDLDALADRYEIQREEIREYASDFPEIFELRHHLIRLVLEQMKGGGRVAEESEPYRVSPAAPADAGSRERLDPLAATTSSCLNCGGRPGDPVRCFRCLDSSNPPERPQP